MIRPSAQSFRLSHGFSPSDFCSAGFQRVLFCTDSKNERDESAANDGCAQKSRRQFFFHSKSAADFVVQKKHERKNSHRCANGNDKSIARLRAAFGSVGVADSSLKIPIFHRDGLNMLLTFSNASRLSRQSCDHDSICSRFALSSSMGTNSTCVMTCSFFFTLSGVQNNTCTTPK